MTGRRERGQSYRESGVGCAFRTAVGQCLRKEEAKHGEEKGSLAVGFLRLGVRGASRGDRSASERWGDPSSSKREGGVMRKWQSFVILSEIR